MQIALFGATGGTGRQTLEQALAQGHSVNALVRTPAKLMLEHPQLTIIQGDVLDLEKVRECLSGCDVVICSLGSTANNPDTIVSDGTRQIITAMQAAGSQRLIVVTSLGVGDSKDQVSFFFKTLMKTVLKKAIADKEVQEKLVRESGLDWIIVRPGGLTDGLRMDEYLFGTDKSIKAGQVSRADVADFLLKQLEDNRFLRQATAVT